MKTEFLTLTFLSALMIISPGPDFAIVVRNSLLRGRVAGSSAAAGIAVANLCHVALNLLGIGLLISQSVLAFTVLKMLGASYLIYIGLKGVFTKKAISENTVLLEQTLEPAELKGFKKIKSSGFHSGFFTSLLNPKVCLFFLSFFSVIVSPETPIPTQIIYGIWISIMAFLWFWSVAIFFTNPAIAEKIKAVKHWLERLTGGLLTLLGFKLLSAEFINH